MSTPTLPPRGACRHYRNPSRVAVYVAKQTGQQPGTVEQAIRGRAPIHLTFARILEAALTLGDEALAGRLIAPVLAVQVGGTLTETPADLLHPDTLADAGEDAPRLAYAREPSAATRNELLRVLRPRLSKLSRLIAALEREQNMERMG